jgi:hypothetical protein
MLAPNGENPMTNSPLTAAQRVAIISQRRDHDESEYTRMSERLEILAAAAHLRSATHTGHNAAEAEEVATLQRDMADLRANIGLIDIALQAAQDDVAAEADRHDAALDIARDEIANEQKNRAALVAAEAVRTKTIALAQSLVDENAAALAGFAAVEAAIAREDALVLEARAAGQPEPNRVIDPKKARRQKFELVEAHEQAQAALNQIKDTAQAADTVAACDTRIRGAVRRALVALGQGAVKLAAHHRRVALRQDILAHAVANAVPGALDRVLYRLGEMSGSAPQAMNGPGGRTGISDAAGVVQRFAAALSTDAGAELNLDAAFADGTVWLSPADRG